MALCRGSLDQKINQMNEKETREWTPYMYVLKIMKPQINLAPYDAKKKLKLVLDGASSLSTGFLL